MSKLKYSIQKRGERRLMVHPQSSIASLQSNCQTAKEVFSGVSRVGGVQTLAKGFTK